MLGIDLDTIRFATPEYLWLLIAPGVLLIGWFWQLAARRRDSRRFRQHRRLPVRERFPVFGNLVFWLCLILASACTILALSRPTAAAALVRTAGVDLVILQDGSASMRTGDVRRQPLAALDALPARARRIAGVEGRSHGDGAVRAHRGAAGAADQGSEHLLLLPRSPRGRNRRSGSRTTPAGTPTSSSASPGACG